jgi:putative ABC transport system permease protein
VILFRLLTWPYLRKHKLRSALTLAGIVIGVAVLVGMHTANQDITQGFRQTVDRIAGRAQLEVSAGETGFPEDVLEKVQSLSEVSAAAPVIEAIANTGIQGQGSLLVLGVDMTGDRNLRDYDFEGQQDDVIDDPLIFLAQPDSIILSKGFAERNGIRRGSRIGLQTLAGFKQFTVRGIMQSGGLASAFGGNLAVMDIYAAQLAFGRGRSFDRIDVRAQNGVSVDEFRAKLSAILGTGLQVQPPSSRAEQFDQVSRGLALTINISSAFALLIGVFIIYNSFAIAVTQRRAEIGVLRALGASQGQVFWLFLGESAIGGVVGAALGIGTGLLLARGIAPYLSSLVTVMYATPLQPETTPADPQVLLFAMLLGIAASVVGAIIPAHRAARADPIQALQKGRIQAMTGSEARVRWMAGAATVISAAVCLWLGRSDLTFYVGYALAIVSWLLFSPALSHGLALWLRPIWKRLLPVEGALATDSLIQAPKRTSATVSALMLSLALAVGFAGVTQAVRASILGWVNTTLNPDLYVTPTQDINERTYRLPATVGRDLLSLPEVDEVQAVRNARMIVRGVPTLAVAVDVAALARRAPVKVVEGRRERMVAECAAGRGIIVSETLSNLRGIHLGDTIELGTPTGVLRLPVLGSIIDFSDQQGSFLLDQSLYRRYWHDDSANIFRVYLKPRANQEKAKENILARVGRNRTMFVFTNAAVRNFVLDLTEQWFSLTYVQLAVALLVAALGIVNTLTVSIADRRREFGVLRAVGALRQQVRLTVWMEAIAIGLIGLVLGWGMGAVALYYNLGVMRRDTAGLALDYHFPFGFALFLLPVVVGVAFIASLLPAESAVRGNLVESLEYE